MSASDSAVLPTPLRRRSEIIGLCAGSLCFLFAFFGNSLGSLFPSGPPAVVLPMVLFSGMAGAAACLLARFSHEGPIGAAPWLGIRAGIFAAITGGALTVWAATLHAFGFGNFPTNASSLAGLFQFFPFAGTYLNLILALLGVPPAIFFGIVGALITTMLSARLAQGSGPASGQRKLFRFRDPIFSAMLAFSTLGYLSPFAVALKPAPKPKRVVAARPSTPAPIRPIISTPPPVPKWRYQKPSEFETSEAQQIAISEIFNLGEIDASLPMALSPDQRQFAWFRRTSGTTLEIRDLDATDSVARIELAQIPAALAWSPGGEKLLVLTAGEPHHFEVIDINTGQVIPLPLPLRPQLPPGRLAWWNPQQVILPGTGESLMFHLDTLRIRPAKDSPEWNALSKDEQERIVRAPSHLPANAFRTLNLQPAILGYDPTMVTGKPSRIEHLHVTFESPHNSFQRPLPKLDLNVDDLLLGTSDGTKIIRIRERQATVFYLSLRDVPPLGFSVKMPGPPDDALLAKMEKKSLCVFICPPIINPLNGKTVGPDRSRVKAIARVLSWNGSRAELWIAEDYSRIALGDVVSDLHVWNDGNPEYVDKFQKDEWFTTVEEFRTTSPPKRKEVTPLDHGWAVSVETGGSADRVMAINVNTSEKPKHAIAPASTPVPQLVVPAIVPVPEPPKATPVDTVAVVRRFMTEHTAKINRGDWEGFVRDFNDPLDYLSDGMVTRALFLNHMRALAAQFKEMHETLKSLEVNQLSPTTFEVLSTIVHSSVVNGVRGTGGGQSLSSIVVITQKGPQITKMRDLGQ